MCLFREACKSAAEAGRKADKSVPAVAKTKSNFLLNGRTGFDAEQMTDPLLPDNCRSHFPFCSKFSITSMKYGRCRTSCEKGLTTIWDIVFY